MPNLKIKNRLNLALFPAVALFHACFALMDGAWKYVAYNYRDTEVSASEYVAAVKRHIDLWYERERNAPDSKAHHLGHAIAGLAILLDAEASKCLIDDRPQRNALRATLEELNNLIEERVSEEV